MRHTVIITCVLFAACAVVPKTVLAEEAATAEVPDFYATAGLARESKNAADAAKLYEDFISANPESPEAAISRVLRGIILWRDVDDIAAAEKGFTAAAGAKGADSLSIAAAELGKRWLSRVRMSRIKKACRAYYLDEVEYPDKLSKLVERKLLDKADLVDAWGDQFVYEPKESKYPRAPLQKFLLKSKNVNGDAAGIPDVLAREKDFYKPFTLKAIQPKLVMVGLKTETLTIEDGQTKGGLTAVRIEESRVILCSHDFVVVLTR